MDGVMRYYNYDKSAVAKYPDIERRMGSDSRNELLKDFWCDLPSGLEGKTILDVGSGDGDITAKIATSNPTCHVVGIDLSAEFIKIANDKSNLDNLEFRLMDFEKMHAIGDRSIDLIISVHALLYATDLHHTFSHLASKLKSGGKIKFLINTLEGKNNGPLPEGALKDKVYPSVLNRSSDNAVLDYCCTSAEVVEVMKLAGFHDIDVKRKENSGKIGANYKFKNEVSLFEIIVAAVFKLPQ